MASQPADTIDAGGATAIQRGPTATLASLPTGKPRPRRAVPAAGRKSAGPVDELALRRLERQRATKFVDDRLKALAETEIYWVPRLYWVITESLETGIALHVIQRETEREQRAGSSGWVRFPAETWHDMTGLFDDRWDLARSALREMGLIAERRYYDERTCALAIEIRFEREAFDRHIAEFRAYWQEQAILREREQRRTTTRRAAS